MSEKSLLAIEIADLALEIEENCREKGWYDKPVDFPTAIALLHSEVSEALEAWRKAGLDSWFVYDRTDPSVNPAEQIPKPEGVGSEFADIFIRLLDYCNRFGIDLIAETERKMAFNRTRPYRHGQARI